MNRRNLVIGLLGLAALVAGCAPSDIIACDPQGCISENKLSTNIANALDNNVVGYVAHVGGLPPIFSGQARTSTDPPSLAMLPTEFTDVASVSKTLTAIGVLQSLAKHGLTINSNISPYIYDDWVRGQNIETITFKDLLTHKSGFRADCGGSNTTYSVLKTIIANGVHLADKMVASYNNCNFALFRELLSPMEGNAIGNLPDLLRAAASADFYISYMNQNVFAPVGIQTRACMPTNNPVFAMLSYPFPAGLTNGTDWGDWTLACGGGGWVLSLGDLFQVVSDLATGNVLLTNAEKMEMNSPNCLGWDCSVRNDCPDPYVCKNGALFNGNIAIWTYLGIFKCTVPVVVIVNSFLPSPYQPIDANGNSIPNNGDIIGLVKDAYNGASVPGAPKPCP